MKSLLSLLLIALLIATAAGCQKSSSPMPGMSAEEHEKMREH